MADEQQHPKQMPTVIISPPPKSHYPGPGEWIGGKFVPSVVQSPPDLEPVRRLIRAAELYGTGRRSRDEIAEWDKEIAGYTHDALPVLQSLLSEVETLRQHNVTLEADCRSYAAQLKGAENATVEQARAELDTVVRRYGQKVEECAKLKLELSRLNAAITKAAEKGLSHD